MIGPMRELLDSSTLQSVMKLGKEIALLLHFINLQAADLHIAKSLFCKQVLYNGTFETVDFILESYTFLHAASAVFSLVALTAPPKSNFIRGPRMEVLDSATLQSCMKLGKEIALLLHFI